MNAPRRFAPVSAPASAPAPARTVAKNCGCSGTRWCAGCLAPDLRRAHGMDPPTELPAFLRERPEERRSCLDPDPRVRIASFDPTSQSCPGCPDFDGVHVFEELVTPTEADRLLEAIEEQSFRSAQSGKQKQHFGARVNFNKRKVRAEGFEGLPAWAGWLEAQTRARLAPLAREAVVSNAEGVGVDGTRRRSRQPFPPSPALMRAMTAYRTTDVFVLRYREQDRSNLDFHIDDTFAYGEAILALSLESDSVMTFLRERPGLRARPRPRERSGEAPGWDCVRVALPARSLSILYGPARFEWQHAILAYDIRGRRTSVTLRTMSPELRGTAAGRLIESRAAASGAAWGMSRLLPSPSPLAASEVLDDAE